MSVVVGGLLTAPACAGAAAAAVGCADVAGALVVVDAGVLHAVTTSATATTAVTEMWARERVRKFMRFRPF
jgi:hypothetical protein